MVESAKERSPQRRGKASLRIAGLPIEVFAGFVAAGEIGIPLRAVLAQEQVEKANWRAAQVGWPIAIRDSDEHRRAFERALLVARDRLGSRLQPLEDDVEAYAGFVRYLNEASDVGRVLEDLGIWSSDLERLERVWRRRFRTNPELASRFKQLQQTASPPEQLQIFSARLRRFPWSPPAGELPEGSEEPNRVVRLQVKPQANQAPQAAVALASFQLEKRPASGVALPQPDADMTLPIAAPPATRPLPFQGSTSPERLRSLLTPIGGDASSPAVGDETVLLGAGQPSLLAPLPLSLADYADLRANLSVNGERHQPTLQRFGMETESARAELRERFARYFQSNPAAQSRFLELLTAKVAELRRK
ncbi:MAG: hypothetical protein U0271_35635 [Polyangiaceae bacterium]